MRRVRRLVVLLAIIYLGLVVMLALLQRSLMYFPDREAAVPPGAAHLPVGQVHSVTMESEDGLTLHGWLVLANGQLVDSGAACDRALAAGRPCVLYFSGNAGNRRYRVDEFRVFTALGCDVLVFDYRGYGENEGSPSQERLAADARAAWSYATEQRQIAPSRMFLFGESLGGAVAVRLAAEQSAAGTPPGGLILRSTFSSMADVGSYHYPWLPVRLVLVDRYPSADRIGEVSCPLLQLHGARDTVVPLQFGRRLFAAAPERSAGGIAKRFVELPDADHNDVLSAAEAEYRRAIAEFLAAARPAGEPDGHGGSNGRP